jgi:hypothetical protein
MASSRLHRQVRLVRGVALLGQDQRGEVCIKFFENWGQGVHAVLFLLPPSTKRQGEIVLQYNNGQREGGVLQWSSGGVMLIQN